MSATYTSVFQTIKLLNSAKTQEGMLREINKAIATFAPGAKACFADQSITSKVTFLFLDDESKTKVSYEFEAATTWRSSFGIEKSNFEWFFSGCLEKEEFSNATSISIFPSHCPTQLSLAIFCKDNSLSSFDLTTAFESLASTAQSRLEVLNTNTTASILEQNRNPVLHCNSNGQLLYANSAGKEFMQSLPGGSDSSLFEAILDCKKVPRLSQFHREFDLEGHVYSVDAVPAKDGNTVTLYLVDVTDQIENKFFTDSILSSVSETLLVVGTENEIVFANDRIHKTLGYHTNEILGANIFDILNLEDTSSKDFQALFRTTSYRQASAHMTDKDGNNHPVLLTTRHLDREGVEQPEILIAAQDAKDSRILDELRSTQEQLLQSGKLAALGEMAAGIAHEINNPVAIIHAASEILELLAAKGKLTEDLVLKNAKEIRATAVRISKIVKGLRTISRDATKDEFITTTFQSVVEDSLGLCQEKVKMAGIHLSVDLPQEPIAIQARPSELSQVLLNFFNNAIDAMENQETKMVHISLKTNEDGDASFRFADNGPGIPEKILEEVFLPFFTTKEPGKGTGLGLSITKKIIHSHGGEISAYNKDRGAVFTFTLPVAQFTSEDTQKAA